MRSLSLYETRILKLFDVYRHISSFYIYSAITEVLVYKIVKLDNFVASTLVERLCVLNCCDYWYLFPRRKSLVIGELFSMVLGYVLS
jgi:hypothetical protein